jgi:4-hydroxymandelate oxidase
MGVEALVNVQDLEPAARAVLPGPVYDYFAGGSEDEATIAANREAFQRWRFRYHVLETTAVPDTRCSLLGQTFSMPVHLAPTATQRLAHPDGELGAARAAAAAGVIYCLSTLASTSLEELAASSQGQRWFQLYIFKDRSISTDLLDRAASSGYAAVIVTVDSPLAGRRERDIRNTFALPEHIGFRNLTDALANAASATIGGSALARSFSLLMDPALTWKDLEWLVGRSRIPVLVKGLVRSDDALRAVAAGAAGIIVSNHGGRQLDYAIASLDALPEVVQAVGSSVPVLVDGGIRRGTDVLKAVALGANGVFIGRPLLWALALGGEKAVVRLLELLHVETVTSMMLLGAKSLADLTPDLLWATG